jgi:hypothetical protein
MLERQVIWASTAGPGGIHNYLRRIQQTPLWTDWNMRHVATHRAGSTPTKIAVFARGTVLFAVHLIRSRPNLVHLHAVDKSGSLFRNTVLAFMSRLARVPVILQVHAMNLDVFYANSPRVVRSMVRGTVTRVDAVLVGNVADGFDDRPDWRRLDALYREVSR